MAINSGRIAAGPTSTRVNTRKSFVEFTNNIPPSATTFVNPDTGALDYVDRPAEREGQLLIYATQNETAMYVVITDEAGLLVWKRAAAISGVIDSTTGKPFGL
jgi:hypothetical protein